MANSSLPTEIVSPSWQLVTVVARQPCTVGWTCQPCFLSCDPSLLWGWSLAPPPHRQGWGCCVVPQISLWPIIETVGWIRAKPVHDLAPCLWLCWKDPSKTCAQAFKPSSGTSADGVRAESGEANAKILLPRCIRAVGASLWCCLWYSCSWSPQGMGFAGRQSWVWLSQISCVQLWAPYSAPSVPPFSHCLSGDDIASTSRVLLNISSTNTCKCLVYS